MDEPEINNCGIHPTHTPFATQKNHPTAFGVRILQGRRTGGSVATAGVGFDREGLLDAESGNEGSPGCEGTDRGRGRAHECAAFCAVTSWQWPCLFQPRPLIMSPPPVHYQSEIWSPPPHRWGTIFGGEIRTSLSPVLLLFCPERREYIP